jgi:ribose transport system permease protein
LLLVVLIVFFSVLPSTGASFSSWANISNLLSAQAVLGIAALGVLLPIVAGHYDLTVGAIVGASSMLSAVLMTKLGLPALLAVVIAVVVGVGLGAISGTIIAMLKVHSLIVTTGAATVIGGLVLWVSGSTTVSGVPRDLMALVLGTWFGIPKVVVFFAIAAVVVYLILEHTTYGRRLHALGANPKAAAMVGLRTRGLVITAFMLSAGIAAFAGVLQLGLQGSASPQLGPGFTLPALSAVFLGSTAIRPGRFNVLGTVIAVYLVAVIVNGLTLAGASSWVEPTFNGLALLVAVSLSALVRRRRTGRSIV